MSENVADLVYAALNANQRRAVEVLAGGGDKAAAAEAAGVTVRTIDRYMNDPNVRAALDKATGTAVSDVARRMVGAMDTAVTTMVNLVEGKETSPTVKLRAAIAIIEHGPKLFEAHDLVKRIEMLEAKISEHQNAG